MEGQYGHGVPNLILKKMIRGETEDEGERKGEGKAT